MDTSRWKSVLQRRRWELAFMLFVIKVIVVITLSVVLLRHDNTYCGPKFESFSVDISHAQGSESKGYKTDGNYYPPGTFWKRGNSIFGCPCLVKPCIRYLCYGNSTYSVSFANGELMSVCIENNALNVSRSLLEYTMSGTVDEPPFVFGEVCSATSKEPGCFLQVVNDQMVKEICNTGKVDDDELNTDVFKRAKYIVIAAILSVSGVFLLATIIVYLSLHSLRDFQWKARICFVACLFFSFSILVAIKTGWFKAPSPWCLLSAFAMQFLFLGYFCWLNIMCFETWWTFSGLLKKRSSSNRKFLKYSVFGFGGPLFFTSLAAAGQFCPWAQQVIFNPHFNENKCWFEDNDANMIYFILPMSCVLVHNLMMFLTSIYRINRSDHRFSGNGGESRRHITRRKHRNRLKTYSRLFLIMGVGWLMEVVRTIFEGYQSYFFVADVYNSLQGIFIFIVLVVWDKKTAKALKEKYRQKISEQLLSSRASIPVSRKNSGS